MGGRFTPKVAKSACELVGFYQTIHAAYPNAERINLVLDNWPIHFHPDVLVALEPQENPWSLHVPKHWSSTPSEQARQKWGERPLPTYASWTNPLEKLWRKFRREVLHLHRKADRLDDLRQEVACYLNQLANGSLDLLRYVGIPAPD